MKVKASFGEILLENSSKAPWKIRLSRRAGEEPGIEYVRLILRSEKPEIPPELKLSWTVPGGNIYTRWSTFLNMRNIVPNWGGPQSSELARATPMFALADFNDRNRWTFAFSDALRKVKFRCGVSEESGDIQSSIELFTVPEAPISEYSAELRIDGRNLYFGDVIRSVTGWYASMKEYKPCPVPADAYKPIYSSWYTFHQSLFDGEILSECRRAAKYGLVGIILDDGWQTDDNARGYAFCGDWKISKKRFPDFRKHVESLHKLGMKCVLWYSVPFVGFKSSAYKRFGKMILHSNKKLSAAVLDPRFPEVREYLTETYVKALKEWDIDGFKLDFIDSFTLPDGTEDPAVKENYKGRDILSVPLAVDVLLSGVMKALRTIKPELLIEFRQSYIGPAVRKYGNMFRAADCPADPLSNRVRTVDLRLSSGDTAVHSDMLMWNPSETAEQAANQLLNVLFSVPQVSVKLDKISVRHRKMLHFWLDFCRENTDILLKGDFHPERIDQNYPVVTASNERGSVTAVYTPGRVVKPAVGKKQVQYIVNASSSEGIFADLDRTFTAEYFDTTGKQTGSEKLRAGLHRIPVPESGLLILK